MTISRDELVATLSTNVADVTYTKATTGETAVMRCTLIESKLPATSGKAAVTNPETLVVADINKGAWRSFKIANVQSVAIV